MKVSEKVSLLEIGVTIAMQWRHHPFYMRPNYLQLRDNFGKRLSGSSTSITTCLKVCKILRHSKRAFLRNFGWSFKVLKYNKNKTVLKC